VLAAFHQRVHLCSNLQQTDVLPPFEMCLKPVIVVNDAQHAAAGCAHPKRLLLVVPRRQLLLEHFTSFCKKNLVGFYFCFERRQFGLLSTLLFLLHFLSDNDLDHQLFHHRLHFEPLCHQLFVKVLSLSEPSLGFS
jgi:hypothetical protein